MQDKYRKSASARAAKYIALLRRALPDPAGYTDLGRDGDDCFECGDGNAVAAWLIAAMIDAEDVAAMIVNLFPRDGDGWWMTRAARARLAGDHLTVYGELISALQKSRLHDKADPRMSPRGIALPPWPGQAERDAETLPLFAGGGA